jgi:hypothetical protein
MMTWTSSAKYGGYMAKGTDGKTYTWSNDCWSDGAGPQTITVNSNNDWGVVSQQTWNEQYWVETYPHIGWKGGLRLSQYPKLTGVSAETGPGYGASLRWEAAYDVWLNNGQPGADSGYEIMVWTDTSNVSPNGSPKSTPTISGVKYRYYQDQGGNGPASWFVREVNAPACTTDLKSLIHYAVSQRGNYTGPADPVVDTVEYGWEVWGTGGKPVHFHMSKYTLLTA